MTFDRIKALPRRSRNVLHSLACQHAADGPDLSARFLTWPRILGAVWQERCDIVDFIRTGNEDLAQDLRRRFGLGAPLGGAQTIPVDLFDADRIPDPQPATLILPVYRAEAAVARLLERLPATIALDQPVILVDDGSDSPRIDALLAGFAEAHPETRILRHAQNKGFVAAVNAGLARRDPSHHAILLNTDTLPPDGWVTRLLAPFASGDDVATVSPLSNAAEILSVPRAGIVTEPAPALVDSTDGLARQLRRRDVELPTGIGFCMAMNRRFLDRVGLFDPAFGRGYGEEVDWCQRATAAGGRHVVATNLFVGHDGAASFGAQERLARVASASRRIETRYPGFTRTVLDWEARDPIGPERLAVALGWLAAATQGPVPVFVAHSLGGGAEVALEREVRSRLAGGHPAVVILRAGGPERWRIELKGGGFELAGDVADDALTHRLLAPLVRREVIYSCAVHAADPGHVPEFLLELSRGQGLQIRLHDFFVISPSWNLLGADGTYRGVPPADTDDPAHGVAPSATHPGLNHAEWRAGWERVIAAANEITAFSPCSRALIEAAYSHARGKVAVRPHCLPALPDPVSPGGTSIGVLGGINRAKGGAVLEQLARTTRRRIVIIGELDGQFRLPPPHVVHGRYAQTEISGLAGAYGIGAWFIPSIWPETFSFATHEALATGLPVACFNLGAQAETLRNAQTGHILDHAPDDVAGIAAALERLFGT